MIGKTIYVAKVRDNKIVIESHTITKVGRKLYHFGGKKSCYIRDVGVVIFLTKKEAKYALIKNLRYSIKMGEQYLHKTKLQLAEALKLQEI